MHQALCFSLMIAAKTVQDSAICAVMGKDIILKTIERRRWIHVRSIWKPGQVSGDELLCLSWMVFRMAFPGILPDFFDADLPYSKQRNIPK